MEDSKKSSEPLISKEEILKMITMIFFVGMHSMNLTVFFSFVSYEGLVFYSARILCFSIFLSILNTVIVTAITKKVSKANLVLNIFFTIYMTLSQVKRTYTFDPIVLSDIKFLNKIPQLARLAFGNISLESMAKPIIMLLLMVIYTILSYYFLKKRDIEINNKKARIVIFVSCMIFLVIMMNPTKTLRNAISRYVYSTDKYVDNDSYLTIGTYFLGYGVLPGLYGIHINNIFYEPDNYNEQELNTLMSQVENIGDGAYGKPNIIMFFSESFFDLEKTNEVKYNVPLCENFNKLKAENKTISVITPTFGGMSENVAFEVITGGSNNYFPIGYIPIMTLYDYDSSEKIPSIVRDLGNNGYKSEIVFGEDDYVSETAYNRVGFGEYTEFRQLGIKGKDQTDELMVDYIKEGFKNKEKDQRVFYLVESFEAHMPYNKEKYDTYDIEITETTLEDPKDLEALQSYSQSIHNADKALKELYDYLQTIDEPTIVIFVGDHLPYLYNSRAENVLEKFDYLNTDDELENLYRRYNTEALVFANYDIDYSKLPDEVSSNLLLDSVVINTTNKLNPYYYWLYSTKNELPAANRYLYINGEGKKDFLPNIDGKEKDIYELREKMQYMLFVKNR